MPDKVRLVCGGGPQTICNSCLEKFLCFKKHKTEHLTLLFLKLLHVPKTYSWCLINIIINNVANATDNVNDIYI